MADRNLAATVDGETRFGGSRTGIPGVFYVQSQGGAGHGSVLALDGISVAGATTTWYLFVTAAGVLRVSSTFPTNTELNGTAV